MTTTTTTRARTGADKFAKRVAGADWDAVTAEVNDYGCALLPQLLKAARPRQWVKNVLVLAAPLASVWSRRRVAQCHPHAPTSLGTSKVPRLCDDVGTVCASRARGGRVCACRCRNLRPQRV